MQFDATYKEYRIKWRYTDKLAAIIWPPDHPLALSEIPTATHEEGRGVLEARTYAVIDAHIEKMNRPK